MAEYIDREKATEIIKEKQKELCPVGRYGRNYVYGSDREKYDVWEDIIDAVRNIPAADVAPVVHGKWTDKGWDGDFSWKIDGRGNCWRVITCSNCCHNLCGTSKTKFCPNCGAKMDREDEEDGTVI